MNKEAIFLRLMMDRILMYKLMKAKQLLRGKNSKKMSLHRYSCKYEMRMQ